MKNRLTILLILTISIVYTQFDWIENGLPIRQGGHIEWQRSGAVGNEGEMIFVWSDTRYGVRDIFAQKVDVNGNLLWDEFGSPVVLASGRQEDPITVSDDNGGAYIVWVDYDAEPEIGDIYAQHILADGSIAWDPRGIALSTVPGKQLSPNICKDGEGGAYVIWDDRSELTQGEIFATHISADGTILEPGIGVLIMNHQAGRSGISLETGGSGHAVLGWADDRDAGGFYKIYAQRIDQNCNTLWSGADEGGVLVCEIGDAQDLTRHPRITYVNNDISVMVWEDFRLDAQNGDVFLQFIDGNGNSLLEEDGVVITAASGPQFLPRVKADNNYAYVVWEDKRNHPLHSDIYAQKIGTDGSILWTNDGHPICTEFRNQYGSRLTTDGEGGVYFIWSDERHENFPEVEVYVQHLNADNVESFDMNGLAASEASYKQELPLVRKDGNGGAFAIWGDWRTGSVGITVQHINPGSGVTLETDGLELYFDIDGDVDKGLQGSLYLGDDKTLVYWQDKRWNPFSVETYGKIISGDYDPQLFDNGFSLSSTDFQYNPQAIKVGEQIFLFYETFNDEDLEHIKFQIFDLNMNLLNDENGASVYDNITPQLNPVLATNDGYLYVAYRDMRDWVSYDVAIQKFDEYGNPQWGEDGILIPLEWDDVINEIIALPGGGCVVFWTGGDSNIPDLNIYYQAFDGNGETPDGWSSSPQLLSDSPQIQNNSIAVDYGNGIFVMWEDYQSGNADLYGQFISYDGSILEDENGIPITTDDRDQYHAQLTYNSIKNEILVVWENNVGTEDSPDFNINGTFVDTENLILSDVFGIVEEVSSQTEPDVYTSQGGTYMILWRDGRLTIPGEPPIYDIYYQEIGQDGFNFPAGGIAVCDFTFNQTNPQINLLSESSDSYILFWNDMRSTGKQDLVNLYGQSITLGDTGCTLMDVNSDGSIDVLDIVLVVGIILESIDPDTNQECAADVNEDGNIDVLDIVLIVAQILEE